MKFLCDQMLGTLAKWLRLFGFDTYYANSKVEDKDLIEIAKKENRVVISRDKELIIQAKRENLKVIEMKITELDDQLKIVLSDINIDSDKVLTRCSICNSLINIIDKADVKNKVPKKVFENNEKFWFCSNCKKYYWMGSHYNDIIKKTKDYN